jgi:diaminopimelate epimerase
MDVLNKDSVEIETMKAKYSIKRAAQIYPAVETVEIAIDTVSFEVSSLPLVHTNPQLLFEAIPKLSDNLKFSAVSITNPHVVSIVSGIDDEVIANVGKTANNSPDIFPQGVNVNFVRIMDEKSIYVKTYERGVGITKSCGTGMTASSIITCLHDTIRLNSDINIYNDGGMIRCRVIKEHDDNYKVIFIGNATYVYKAQVDLDLFLQGKPGNVNKEYFNGENTAYDNFLNHVLKILSN